MRHAFPLAWMSLLAGMWLAGGAFRPETAAVAGLLAAVLTVLTLSSFGWPAGRGERLLALWIGWSCLGLVVLRTDPAEGVERLAVWLVALAAFHAASRSPESPMERAVLAAALVGIAIPALGEWVGFGVPRVAGIYDNPNILAMLLLPALPIALAASGSPWFRVAFAAIVLCAVAVTGSRAAILALVAMGFVALPARLRRAWPLLLLAAAALLAWRATAWPDALALRRPAIWRAATRLALASPLFGSSAGGFDEAVLPYRAPEPSAVARWTKRPGNAESTPVQALAETGFPGAFLLLAGTGLLLSGGVGRAWADPGRRGTLVAIGAFALVHDALGVPVVLWTWAWLGGRALGAEPSPSKRVAGPVALRLLGGLSVLLLIVWALVAPEAGRALLLRSPVGEARQAVHRLAPLWDAPFAEAALASLHDPEPWTWMRAATAIDFAGRAVRLHSGSARNWRTLAECLARGVREVSPAPATAARAEAAFARATRLDPHTPWAWLGWARLTRDRGDLSRAAALARRAVEEEPSLVAGWLLLGRIALDSGRIGMARQAVEAARAARVRGRGRLLSRYERELLAAPAWQFRQLEEQLP